MKWEHDGTVPPDGPDTRPRLPDGNVDWSRTKHRHVLVPDGPFVADGGLRGEWIGISGRHCNFRGCPVRDDKPICVKIVSGSEGRWTSFHRCSNFGRVVRDTPHYPQGDRRNPPRYDGPEGSGWWYCAMHDPVVRKERQDARMAEWRAKWDADSEAGDAEDALLEEAWRWWRDENATEGFCAPEAACEHHECRLARAVERYAAAHPTTVSRWTSPTR